MSSHSKTNTTRRSPPGSWLWICLAMAAFCGIVARPSSANAMAGPLSAAFASDADFKAMSNGEMSKERGGFDGVAFGVYFTGVLNQPVSSSLPPGVTVSTTPSQIQIVGGLGSFGNAAGIFQFTNIIGNMNVVNNNIIVNIAVQPQSPTNSVSTVP
jgi:hypothetical protein